MDIMYYQLIIERVSECCLTPSEPHQLYHVENNFLLCEMMMKMMLMMMIMADFY